MAAAASASEDLRPTLHQPRPFPFHTPPSPLLLVSPFSSSTIPTLFFLPLQHPPPKHPRANTDTTFAFANDPKSNLPADKFSPNIFFAFSSFILAFRLHSMLKTRNNSLTTIRVKKSCVIFDLLN